MTNQSRKIFWKPHPRQAEALKRTEFEILFGGSRGGGKSEAGIIWLIEPRYVNHSEYRALVIRRNAEDLRDWIDRAKRMYIPVGGVVVGNPPEIRFPSGAIIRTGHLKDEDAFNKYLGHEYQKILIEELTQIPREQDYLKLLGSCRSTIPELKPQVFSTTNPGGVGHLWCKVRFIDVAKEGEPFVDPITGRTRIFIPAKATDNPTLVDNNPDYLTWLDGLPDGLREAWRDGSWEIYEVEGSYYSLLLSQARNEGRITNVPWEQKLKVHTWWDLGISSPTAIGFFQNVGKEWRVIDYFEDKGNSISYYKKVLDGKPYSYGEFYAPHDIEVKDMVMGETRKNAAKSLGINFKIVKRTPIEDGINALSMRFNTLWIDKTKCKKLLEALLNYRREYDEKENYFKDKPHKDWTNHGADMMRYWASGARDYNPELHKAPEHKEFNPFDII